MVTSSVSGEDQVTLVSTSAVPVAGMAMKSLGRPARVKSAAAEYAHCESPLASNSGHGADWYVITGDHCTRSFVPSGPAPTRK